MATKPVYRDAETSTRPTWKIYRHWRNNCTVKGRELDIYYCFIIIFIFYVSLLRINLGHDKNVNFSVVFPLGAHPFPRPATPAEPTSTHNYSGLHQIYRLVNRSFEYVNFADIRNMSSALLLPLLYVFSVCYMFFKGAYNSPAINKIT
mgnify:FL=1